MREHPAGLTGLVLCGGRSVRMGLDKANLLLGGVPLVLHVAGRMATAADPVLLAPGRVGRLGDLGYREIEDEVPGAGPLSGLVAGLAASAHPMLAAVAVDMPFLSPAVFDLLARSHGGEDAVVPRTERGLEPLHAVYSRSALPPLRTALADGRLGLVDAVRRLRIREVAEDEWRAADPSARFAVNLNRPGDLSILE